MTFSSIPRPHLPTRARPRILLYTEAGESGVPDKELGHTIFIMIVFISLMELDLIKRSSIRDQINEFQKTKLKT